MPLESVTHISDLNVSNPPGTDAKNQGDDHIRNIKIGLRTDFPNINGVVNATPAQLNLLASLTALSVLGNPTNAGAAPQAIVAASDRGVLQRVGTTLAFNVVEQTSANAVSNPNWFAAKGSTQGIAGTSFVDVTGFTGIALATSGLYLVEFQVKLVNTGAAGFGIKLNFSNAPAEQFGILSVAKLTAAGLNYADTLDNANGNWTQSDAGAATFILDVRGHIKANAVTGGTFALQMRQNAAVGTSTIQIASPLRLQRLV